MNNKLKKSARFLITVVLLLSGLVLPPAIASRARVSGAIIYVSKYSNIPSYDGSSWAHAYHNIQDALAAASSGDQIWVARGTYQPGTTQTDTYQLINGVEVYGGFPGNPGTEGNADIRDPWLHPTILNGNIGAPNFSSDNIHHIVTGSGTDSSAVLDGFLISEGYAASSSGGGMLNVGGSPTVRNVVFYQNHADDYGGGMSITDNSSPLLVNVIFQGNTAVATGGGLDIYDDSHPTLVNLVFSGNTANFGGGMSIDHECTATLSNLTFSHNEADIQGGGIYIIDNSSLTVSNTILWENTAPTGPEIYREASGSASYSYSLVKDSGGSGSGWDFKLGADGGDNLDSDPLFMHTPDSGSDGTWGTSDDDYGGLRLKTTSPALDQGTNTIPVGVTSDLPGNPRAYDQPGVANGTGGYVDLGAYEAPPRQFYVDQDAGGVETGLTWGDAFTDLQAAVKWGWSGPTEIWVAEGSYQPGISDFDGFDVKDGVSLYGGFPQGGGDGSISAADPWEHPTTLDGDLGSVGVRGDNCRNIVMMKDIHNETILDGFIIYDGAVGMGISAAGLDISNGSPTIRNTIFLNNYSFYGGGMTVGPNSDPWLENLVFQGNVSLAEGGGIKIKENSDPTLVNLVFSGNTAPKGGGLYIAADSRPTLTNLTLSYNEATDEGGGIYIAGDSNATLENSILWGNSATTGDQIYREITGTLRIYYSLIQGSGGSGGGWDSALGIDGGGNLDTGPSFIRLPNAGADSTWGTEDDDYGDLRLGSGSLVIDQGDDKYVSAISTDLPGNPRLYDHPGVPNGAQGYVDMGAYETPPERLYVDEHASGSETGLSWINAFTDLQSALQWGLSGPTEIWVAEGIYKPGTERTDTFQLSTEVCLHGGFPMGGGDGSYAARDPWEHVTILSGDIGVNQFDEDNVTHVINGSGTDNTAVLDGFVVYKGYTEDGDPGTAAGFGAGMLNLSGNPTVKNTVFLLNSASYGGGMGNDDSGPILENVIFLGNTAGAYGGGMQNDNASSPTLVNLVFSGNTADYGGGISISNESGAKIVNTTFSQNEALSAGGGVEIDNASSATIDNAIYWDNTAPAGPQIFRDGTSTAGISFSLIEGSGGSGTGWDASLGTDNGGNLDADPLFVRPPDPSYDSAWGTMDDDYGDLRLQTGSPAIDQGSNKKASIITTDLPGNPRLYNQPGVPDGSNGYVDMGAYETPATRLYVDYKATGVDTGLSWTNAYTNLQSAVKWSRSGPVDIWIAEGEYAPGPERSDYFQLRSRVALYGGFPSGGGDGTFGARDWGTYPTSLNGNIADQGTNTDNAYHLIYCSDADDSAVIDGLIVTGGYANSTFGYTLTWHMQNIKHGGGGMYNLGCDASLTRVRIENNYALYNGGGMENLESKPTLQEVTFTNNQGMYGGGMYTFQGELSLENVIFNENAATSDGGGMYNSQVYAATLINLTFLRNTASQEGGGMYTLQDGSDLVQPTFKGNTAGINGGGITLENSDITLVEALFSGNMADFGGGIFNHATGTVTLINPTFSGNQADSDGGGLLNAGSAELFNAVFWGNTSPSGPQMFHDTGGSTVSDYGLIQGGCPSGVTCTHPLSSDPQFERAPDPGLDGTWGTSDDDYGNLHLAASSPAIDAGDNTALPQDSYDLDDDGNTSELLPYDLDGLTRQHDVNCIADTGSGTAPIVDLGAYEAQYELYCIFVPLVLK